MTRTVSGELPAFDAPANGELTEAMVAAYHEAGVIILSDFVAVSDCEALRARARELVDEFDPNDVQSVFSTTDQAQLDDQYFIESGDKIRFFLEANAFDAQGVLRQSKAHSLNKMGHAMHDLDPVFERFSHSAALDNIARRVGVQDPGVLQSMYIFKPPRIGGEVHCHQDSTFIYTEPESCVGFWFALEDATVDNGCMQFIPGGHKLGLKERQRRGADGKLHFETLDETPWPEGAAVPAEAKTGTLVVFDGRSPHMSGPNLSDNSRCAYTLHVIDKTCDYPAENWLQRGADMPLRGFAA